MSFFCIQSNEIVLFESNEPILVFRPITNEVKGYINNELSFKVECERYTKKQKQ